MTAERQAQDAINLIVGAVEQGRWTPAHLAAQDGIIAAFVERGAAVEVVAAARAARDHFDGNDTQGPVSDRLRAALAKMDAAS